MDINIYGEGSKKIAEVITDGVIIGSEQDALDLMVNSKLGGARKIVLHKQNLSPDFFELSSGLAGKVLQKFINYQVQLAIVGDFENITSSSLKAFIYESNRGKHIFFLKNVEEAIKAFNEH